jgi:WD40 repeat protein/serine/threonine protein kinase
MPEPESLDSPLVGRKLGEFVVREPLSAGGMGTVFRAEQPTLAREAVIKVLHTRLRASENLIARFLREARLASRLDHPYAAHIYAFGAEPDGVLWIAMELVRGTPLDKLLEAQGPISLERFVPLLERICEVVQTAHDQGIVHRDLKPANIMALARAGQLLPKLLDLGIAKLDDAEALASGRERQAVADAVADADTVLGREDALADTAAPLATTNPSTTGRLTEEGAIMGSPLYMAPEQWTDAAAVDARTDIYALGVLCHEALTGKPPFTGINRFAIAMAHAQSAPPPLPGSFPAALTDVIAKAMAKQPHQRYASPLELATAFKAASGIADEAVVLPRIAEELRTSVLARAPQPLAQAVAALEAARNAHQARDAVWQVVRVAARLVGVTALACYAHVGDGGKLTDSSVTDALRRLRRRTLPDLDWLALARDLVSPFRRMREVYPVPELVDFTTKGSAPLDQLLELRDAGEGGASDEQARDVLAQAIPLVEELLRSLDFFGDYRLVVTAEGAAELWMGVRRTDPPRITLRGARLPAGQPALASSDGLPVISLYPFVQHRRPAPSVPEQLFFFEGKGRRGARLVALPETFEVEDEALWEVLGGLVREPTASDGTPTAEEVCPFPGLASFTTDDATRFFGRERETEGFVNRLRAQAMLAVVGPSGAGKSSFIQAGVVPNLPADWQVITLRPGAAPLISLTARLATVGFDAAMMRAELNEHAGGLGTMLRTRLSGQMLVIVVDQLEELFTLCEDAAERNLFVEALVRATRSADDPVRVVFTLRDDFLLHAEALPPLRARLAPALHLLTTPGRDELLRILREPLRLASYELDDPKLADDMVDALATTRSALALLSFTASKLWELRDRRFRQLTRKAYGSLGGVGGALAKHAEEALAAMLPEEQRLVREVFRHAVTAEGTRAVLSRAELDQVLGGGPYATAVVEKLVAARLLVSAESASGGEQIELTHEALIDAWPRLVTWRREDAEGARLRDQLRAAARQWEERGRPSGLLWRGDALAEYRLWRGRYPGTLTAVENAFAAASVTEAARAGRRRTITIAVAFAVLTAGVIALIFFYRNANEQKAVAQQRAAELLQERRDQAEEQGRSAWVDVHDAPLALRYLQQAADLGVGGPAHDLLVALASRVPASKLHQLAMADASEAAAFSPDGTRVVTACDDGSAHVWDVASGQELLVVHQDHQIVRAEITSDGTSLLTGGYAGVASLWDLASGKLRYALRAGADHDEAVLCARVSPDRRFIVTATSRDTAALWDAATGQQLAALTPTGDPHVVASGVPCAFSADSTLVAVGDAHGVTRIWSTATGKLRATAAGHTDQIYRVELSPDGRRLATASGDWTAGVWDVATGKRLQELRHRARVWTALFSPDGKRVVTASDDHTAVVWNADTGERVMTLAGHASGVNKAVFRSDGAQIATVGDDGVAFLWDADTGRRESSLQGHEASIEDVQYDPTGAHLVTAGDDNRAVLWSSAAQQPAVRLIGHKTIVWAIAFSHDGSRLATSDLGGTIHLWDVATGAMLATIAATGSVYDVHFSPDDRELAAATRDGFVHVWEVASGREMYAIAGHTQRTSHFDWAADGKHIAVASEDGRVSVAAVPPTGNPQWIVTGGHPVALAFAPSHDELVTVTSDGESALWDLRDPRTARTKLHGIAYDRIAFDHSGKWLLGSSENQSTAMVWPADGKPENGRALRGHRGNVMDSAWSPEGTFVLTGSIDSSARLWDPRTGKQVAAFDLELSQVWSVAYSSDGHHIATGTKDGAVLIWELPATTAK